MAKKNPEETYKQLSEQEQKQVDSLTSGGLSLAEALSEIGVSAIGEDTPAGTALKAATQIGIGAATGGPFGALAATLGTGAEIAIDEVAKSREAKKKKEASIDESIDAQEETDGNRTLEKIGSGLGAAQTVLGLVEGQTTDIPEFSDSQYTKKAADMLTKAHEEGIDPLIVSEAQKGIEMRRRSTLYSNQGGSRSSGESYNRDVAANLLANRAENDLAVSLSREKDRKLAPAASALSRLDEIEMRKDLARRDQAKSESEAAGSMIGAGIDNIIGSLMLGEQFKQENERKKYE